MNTNASTAEPPPSTTNNTGGAGAPDPQQNTPASRGLADAAKAHEHFLKTGQKPEPGKTPTDKAGKQDPPAAKGADATKADKGGDKSEKGDKADKAKSDASDKGTGGLSSIKPKPTVEKKPDASKDKGGDKGTQGKSDDATKGAAAESDDMPAKEQTRWMELRAKEAELEKLKPEFDATRKEKEEWLKEKKIWEEERKELEQLRRRRDFEEVESSEAYQKDVDIPFNKIQDKAMEVAEYAGVDFRELMKAMQEPNALKREDRIKEVLEGAKNEVKPGNISILVQHGDELKGIFTAMQKYQKEASEKKAQFENEQKAEKLRVETETKAIREKAEKEALSILKTNASDVFSEEDLNTAYDRAKKRRDEPMDNAFRDVSEFLVPTLIEKHRDQAKRIEELEADLKEALDGRPGITPTRDKPNGKEPRHTSLAEATAAHREARAAF